MPDSALLLALAVGVVTLAIAAVAGVGVQILRSFRELGSDAERATYQTLHSAALAGGHLRAGLTPDSAARAARHLRALLGCEAIALLDADGGLLTWDGAEPPERREILDRARDDGRRHRPALLKPTPRARTRRGDRGQSLGKDRRADTSPGAATAPVRVDGEVVGLLLAVSPSPGAGLLRATTELASWLGSQLELADLERSRTMLVEAELKALRAQISPHFIYNSLNAIASFINTDPARARELVLEFADFTRYSFRRHGDFTTLAEELRSIDRYLLLERARFGERLQLSLTIAPEVLSTIVPFLSLQPLVENAVRHGLESRAGTGTITIKAYEEGGDAVVSVEDDGVGMDPERLRALLAGQDGGGNHVGLRNVDLRLRQVYGDGHGLVVETAPGEGTLVSLRVPKSQPRHEV
ncbi:two-component system LytT family sensor kinase [Arthrobacter woluwensis]|uniref:sensor histidine kinase n=1 Tax=Arthrobacter woluwensis TaxID=156980 RepID=UPI00278017AE|nr:histidine kinase [Arthrobacter woluwensis]MDQ0708209.1 two-component system LytT family sensor kinase [Arthrobacter woluwensis]